MTRAAFLATDVGDIRGSAGSTPSHSLVGDPKGAAGDQAPLLALLPGPRGSLAAIARLGNGGRMFACHETIGCKQWRSAEPRV